MTAPSYEDLQEQVAHLNGLLAELRGAPPLHAALRQEFGLTPKQAGVLALMIGAPRTSCDAIYANVFEHANGDGPCWQIIRVVVSQLRRRLEAFRAPGKIVTHYGSGIYEMSPDLRAWLKARLAASDVAVAA